MDTPTTVFCDQVGSSASISNRGTIPQGGMEFRNAGRMKQFIEANSRQKQVVVDFGRENPEWMTTPARNGEVGRVHQAQTIS